VNKLPSDTTIAPEKLRDYLLAGRDESDKSQFLALGGFIREHWEELETALCEQILSLEAEQLESTPFGQKYMIRGALQGINGKTLHIVTIWIYEESTHQFRFVTLRPDKERIQ
jgi:hypothetical protein